MDIDVCDDRIILSQESFARLLLHGVECQLPDTCPSNPLPLNIVLKRKDIRVCVNFVKNDDKLR